MTNNLYTKIKLSQKHIFLTLTMFFSTLMGTLTAYAQEIFDVRVVIDGKWNVYNTSEKTVGALLEKNNIKLDAKDIIDTKLDTPINKDMVIKIDKADTVNFVIDDRKTVPFLTNKTTIGTVLKEFNEEKKQNLLLCKGQSSAADIKDGMEIKLYSYEEKITSETEAVPFETIIEENPNLYVGNTFVKTKGVDGVKEIKTKTIYQSSKYVSTEVVSEEIIKQPITQVIEKGTKQYEQKQEPKKTTAPTSAKKSAPVVASGNTIKTESGTYAFSKKLSMKSTAYTAGYESTGKRPGDAGYGITASGMKAREGVVAVDTNVIPMGTRLYIEGYGHAIAGDTGSAIKGNKIDVFFEEYSDAINYGVKNVDVYILGNKVS